MEDCFAHAEVAELVTAPATFRSLRLRAARPAWTWSGRPCEENRRDRGMIGRDLGAVVSWDHGRRVLVDGMNDLGVVDPA